MPPAIFMLRRYQHLALLKLIFNHSPWVHRNTSTSSFGAIVPQIVACAAGGRQLLGPRQAGTAAGGKQRGEAARPGRQELARGAAVLGQPRCAHLAARLALLCPPCSRACPAVLLAGKGLALELGLGDDNAGCGDRDAGAGEPRTGAAAAGLSLTHC